VCEEQELCIVFSQLSKERSASNNPILTIVRLHTWKGEGKMKKILCSDQYIALSSLF
jgi:hypothetical protein